MKITQPGQTPAERFIGEKDRCRTCRTVVEFERDDITGVKFSDDGRESAHYLPWTCPHCGASNQFWRGDSYRDC